jgi:hypothetical protein
MREEESDEGSLSRRGQADWRQANYRQPVCGPGLAASAARPCSNMSMDQPAAARTLCSDASAGSPSFEVVPSTAAGWLPAAEIRALSLALLASHAASALNHAYP